MTEAYPLQWPPQWPRTERPTYSAFRNPTRGDAITHIFNEVRRLGGKQIVISTNLTLNRDGTPSASSKRPMDQGVAVYFRLNDKDQCFPCDRWNTIEDNLWAIGKCIEALRGLERWGAKTMVNAAFTGFQALPDYTTPPIQYFDGVAFLDLKIKFKELAKELHPDAGGDAAQFSEMNRQYEERVRQGQ